MLKYDAAKDGDIINDCKSHEAFRQITWCRQTNQKAFFDILKFSMKERFRGQRQRKVDDM